MLNFGKLTNEELINLLAATKGDIVAPTRDQVEKWHSLFNKASEELERRLGEKEIEVRP